MKNNFFTPVDSSLLFKGRPQDPRLGEWVKAIKTVEEISSTAKTPCVIWGAPDDTGVLLNKGRAGANLGPDAIRKHLYRMTMPMDLEWEKMIALFDAGNLIPSEDIKETQNRCEEMMIALAKTGAIVIALGGGHDFAAPHVMGMIRGSETHKKKKAVWGLTNVDPHLDVRMLENNNPNSGTPFRQILESKLIEGKNFVEFGIRANRNSRNYYQYCLDHKVDVRTFEEIKTDKLSIAGQFTRHLKKLSQKCDLLACTFDMDTCHEAEGTSAAPVLGFTTWQMCQMAEVAGKTKKVKLFEIAETAPALDNNERSARIAAEMIYFFLRAKSH